MGIILFALAALFSLPLWLISRHFRAQLAPRERVVMKWSLGGEPIYWASPRMALALTPVLGTLSLLFMAALAAFATPAEDRLLATLPLAAIGAVFAAIHGAHLHFAARADEAK
jgi:hypothetical protein